MRPLLGAALALALLLPTAYGQQPSRSAADRAAAALMRAGAEAMASDIEARADFNEALTIPDVANKPPEVQQELLTHLRGFPSIVRLVLNEHADAPDSAARERLISALERLYAADDLPAIAAFLESAAGQTLASLLIGQELSREAASEDGVSEADRQAIEAFYETKAGTAFMNQSYSLLYTATSVLGAAIQESDNEEAIAYVIRGCEIIDLVCTSPDDPRLRVLRPR